MQGVHYFVRASAFNVKGWGPPQCSTPSSAAPSSKYNELHTFDGCGHVSLQTLHYFSLSSRVKLNYLADLKLDMKELQSTQSCSSNNLLKHAKFNMSLWLNGSLLDVFEFRHIFLSCHHLSLPYLLLLCTSDCESPTRCLLNRERLLLMKLLLFFHHQHIFFQSCRLERVHRCEVAVQKSRGACEEIAGGCQRTALQRIKHW